MKALKNYIKEKESITELKSERTEISKSHNKYDLNNNFNTNILHNKNNTKMESSILNHGLNNSNNNHANILLSNSYELKDSKINNEIFDQLKKFLDEESKSIKYRNIIMKYFSDFNEYLNKKRKRKRNNTNNLFNKGVNVNCIIKKININDALSFVNEKYKSYKKDTKNCILSKMRKYIKLINNEFTLDFKTKILFPRKLVKDTRLNESELISLINGYKMKNDLENLIIFYFLYYSGLTFSCISRIILNNFKMDFSLLLFKKGILKRINIPLIIKNNLIIFARQRRNKSQFFFYELYKGNKTLSRTDFIKFNFSETLNLYNENANKKYSLIKDFSKMRKYKILSKKYYSLFDFTYNSINNEFTLLSDNSKYEKNDYNNNSILLSLDSQCNSFKNDNRQQINDETILNHLNKSNNKLNKDKKKIRTNEKKLVFKNKIKKRKENIPKNLEFSSIESDKKKEYLLIKEIDPLFDNKNSNIFFRKRFSCNLNRCIKDELNKKKNILFNSLISSFSENN